MKCVFNLIFSIAHSPASHPTHLKPILATSIYPSFSRPAFETKGRTSSSTLNRDRTEKNVEFIQISRGILSMHTSYLHSHTHSYTRF